MDGPPTPATVGIFSTSPHPALLLDGCYIEMNQWTALRQGEEQGMMSHYIQALLWQVVKWKAHRIRSQGHGVWSQV